MALTRARVLVGSPPVREELGRIIGEVLGQERDEAVLRADLLKMRGEIAPNKPPKGVFDAKLMRGGPVALEFIVNYMQLGQHKGRKPGLGQEHHTVGGETGTERGR